jgi:hypothetical protein
LNPSKSPEKLKQLANIKKNPEILNKLKELWQQRNCSFYKSDAVLDRAVLKEYLHPDVILDWIAVKASSN